MTTKTKPFNLEEAKAGAKLVTRDGRPARVGIWDATNKHGPLIGLLLDGDTENMCQWHASGQMFLAGKDRSDLLILCEPKLRPWKPEEVPVGCWYRRRGTRGCSMILSNGSTGGCFVSDSMSDGYRLSHQALFDDFEHSTDNGKTWHPCGVEE